jgi:Beta-lactamase.
MRGRRAFIAGLVLLVAVVGAKAGAEGRAARTLSTEGLAKVSDYIRNQVVTGKIPGAILLLQQHGKPVYYENFGVRDVGTQISMSADTIFPPLFDVEADHISRGDDAGRGRQAFARRSRIQIHSGLCRHEGGH